MNHDFRSPNSIAVDSGAQALEDVGRDQACDVAAEAEDLFHHAGADKRVAAGGLEEDGLNLWGKTPVHERHLKFVLVVGDRADTAQHGGRLKIACELDHEAVECRN